MSRPSPSFDAEALPVLKEVRLALADVLECFQPAVASAADLRHLLKLDKRLGWSIFKAATAEDVRVVAGVLPGARSMDRFLEAAARQGASSTSIERVRTAYAAFERAVERHARSRDVFAAMVRALGDEGDAVARGGGEDERHKREAFHHMSILWGREARVSLVVLACHPSAEPEGVGLLDRLSISGMIALRMTRADAPLVSLVQHGWTPATDNPEALMAAMESNPTQGEPVGLLTEFCSRPTPRFRFTGASGGAAFYELVPDGVGATSEVTYMTERIVPQSVESELEPPDYALLSSRQLITTPVVASIHDVFLHESVWDDLPPLVQVYSTQAGRPVSELGPSDLLPLAEKASYLGRGIDVARTPLIPRYAEMLAQSMRRLGWNPDEMRLFRCRVNYPPLSSAISLRFARSAPLKPAGGA